MLADDHVATRRAGGGKSDNSGAADAVTADSLLVSEDAKIISEGDGEPGLNFGTSVAMDGDTLLIGRTEGQSGRIGSAYVFVRSGGGWVQQAKLTQPDNLARGGTITSQFGFSVALSGDTAVVGDAPSGDFGAVSLVYVYVRTGDTWTHQATLTDSESRPLAAARVAISGDTILFNGSGGGAGAERAVNVFVRSGTTWASQAILSLDQTPNRSFEGPVAVSGDTALVGAPASSDDGAAYVFQRSGTTWTRQAKLLPNAANARFGSSVALEGNTAVVGAPGDRAGPTGSGAVYVFERTGVTWAQLDKLFSAEDGTLGFEFGSSTAISGNTVVIGRQGEFISGGVRNPSVHVFLRAGAAFTQQAKLLGQEEATGFSDFGVSVSVEGNTLIAGAPRENVGANTLQGRAYVFNRTGTAWNQETRLTASDGASSDNFGTSVALDGDTLLVGADSDQVGNRNIGNPSGNGSAQVYVRSGADWVFQARLLPSGFPIFAQFGWSVDLDGDTAVVGALQENSNRGAAYVFVRSGEDWIEQARLSPPEEIQTTFFGSSVSVQGDTAVVSARISNGMTAAYVFQRSGNVWTRQAQLTPDTSEFSGSFPSVSLSGNTVLLGNDGDGIGIGGAYVFVRSGGSVWSQQATLRAFGEVGQGGKFFGNSVALDGDTALIVANPGNGAVYVFIREGTIWTEQTKLEKLPNPPLTGGGFGTSVALSGDVAVVGATRLGTDKGAAYVFGRTESTWTESITLVASDGRGGEGRGGDSFGSSVALSGGSIVVGAESDTNSSGRNAGAVYVYRLADTLDFGDAPAPYPTLLANDGARHTVGSLYLGLAVDTDPDGRPNSGATGDDIAGTDDEDGVSFPGGLDPGAPATLQAFVTGAPALLDAWLDFNADGDWNDAGERIADHSIVMPGDNAIVFNVPAGAAQGLSFARVRLSGTGVDAPTGAAADGEVEDEIVVIGPASLSIGDVRLSEGNAGTTAFVFPVSLSRTLPDSVFVDFATETGTAGASDFATVSGTLEIPAGSVRANITVQVHGDTVFEPDDSFVVRLSDPVGAVIGDGSGLGTILNDEARPSVAFVESTRLVPENGGSVSLTVQLSGASSQAVSVPFSVSGTASAADYSGLSASPVVIAAGATSATINLTLTNDSLDEPNESLVLTLGTPVNADRGTRSVLTLTIQDDDDPPAPTGPQVFFSSAAQTLNEAPTRVSRPSIRLSAPSSSPVTVPIIYSGTAIRGADYTGPNQVTFPAGATRATLDITLRNDALDETTETIVTTLGPPTNARLGNPSQRTLQIVDDDPRPVIFFNPGSIVVNEGQGLVTARLRLNRISGKTIVVNFSRSGGNAETPDFDVLPPTTVTIPAGATGANISFSVIADGRREGLERFVLRPTSAPNANIGTLGLTVFIRDR